MNTLERHVMIVGACALCGTILGVMASAILSTWFGWPYGEVLMHFIAASTAIGIGVSFFQKG